jgi:hypothetical protein
VKKIDNLHNKTYYFNTQTKKSQWTIPKKENVKDSSRETETEQIV